MSVTFNGGRNIAMKVPPHQYEATVRFYRDVVGLRAIDEHLPDVSFAFGSNRLWIDRVEGMSQAELWLELVADDVGAASKHLEAASVVRCDEIERLPDGFKGFWISSPASIVHLVSKAKSEP
jgi:catechol 2,3-dioxygenase-like lactoylglutathione lyase family enzyme